MENNQINNNIPSQEEIIQKMISDQNFRLELVTGSHYWFAHCYFSHYITYPTAEFQKEMFGLTENEKSGIVVVVAFRGSAKSTIFTMSYPIWAILGKQQKKFVIILSQTQRQARQHLVNLKQELERNKLLLQDLGPFEEETDEWGGYSLVLPKYGAKIMAASTEQSVRGLRHREHRPDLIVADDIEDLQSVKTREGRNKVYNWLLGDVIPAGGPNTKVAMIGNLLHEDSIIMRLKSGIEAGEIAGTFRAYPLVNSADEILWPGKYPSFEAIIAEKKKIGSEIAWQREFLLNIIPDEDQVIYPEWIQFYDQLPDFRDRYRKIVMGVDLAISQKDTADYTAIVSALIFGYEENFKMFILPNPVNSRMNFPQTIEQIDTVYDANKKLYSSVKILVEDVAYQKAVIDQLYHNGYRVEGIKVSSDKRSRLMSVSSLIQNGKIVFPKKGAEELIEQLVGFGVERHDDLVDAFTIVAHKAIEEDKAGPRISFVGWDGSFETYKLFS